MIKIEKDIEKKIYSFFTDTSNRWKKTPIYESSLQVRLEELYPAWKVSYALEKLEKKGILGTKTIKTANLIDAKFYFHKKMIEEGRIDEKINRLTYWIKKHSDYKIRNMLGNHLHKLVKTELRAQGFEIKDEKNPNSYEDRKWVDSNDKLDIIAKHVKKKLVIGVEVKNMISLIPKSEIMTKIKMCEYLGIIPVFACRWLEPYRDMIKVNGGFLWQFKKQLYPYGQEEFVDKIRVKIRLPVEVNSELPEESIKEFERFIEKK